ncbi:hypothetical protein CEB3_c48750 [Peptococcaceae bacterium CEB3]|nr:hypothetical protein CEB3_c48750 [Peptococcaceae bacterium CEB3]
MVRLGIEELLTKRVDLLHGKKVGLVTNYAVTDVCLQPVIRILASSTGWQLSKLFGPEHGVRISAREGENVDTGVDEATGLPAISLYGPNKKPTPEMLEDLDVLVVDLHDIGCRYYTNMNTVAYCIEACAEVGLPCIVLDRPNPIDGITREGNILDLDFKSFVGMYAIPNRHGLTMGELALFMNHLLVEPCSLTVVPMTGWERRMLLSDTGIPFVPSSPNTTGLDMCLLYPGTCLFEGVNLSVGRGTAHPFEYIGAPFVDANQITDWFNRQGLPGVKGRPVYFSPYYSQYKGELCQGIALHITNRRTFEAVKTGLILLQGVAELYADNFQFLGHDRLGRAFIDLLAGGPISEFIQQGHVLNYLAESAESLEVFNQEVRQFQIY